MHTFRRRLSALEYRTSKANEFENFHQWQQRVRSSQEYKALKSFVLGLSPNERSDFRKELQATLEEKK